MNDRIWEVVEWEGKKAGGSLVNGCDQVRVCLATSSLGSGHSAIECSRFALLPYTNSLLQHRRCGCNATEKAPRAAENLVDVVGSLTPEEQESVKQFIDFLKRKGSSPPSPFLAAVDESIDQHPELLRRLAQ
jgi:hypothetical protein